MKPSPRYDFPVGVGADSTEYSGATRNAFSGIYTVTLNHIVLVTFVPSVNRQEPWPPALPEDFDSVSDSETARRSMIALARLSITPDDSRAGTIERHGSDKDARTIFYVRQDEFAVFARELEVVSDKLPGVHDTALISELGDQSFVRFLLDKVLPSGRLTDHALQMLGRKSDGRSPSGPVSG